LLGARKHLASNHSLCEQAQTFLRSRPRRFDATTHTLCRFALCLRYNTTTVDVADAHASALGSQRLARFVAAGGAHRMVSLKHAHTLQSVLFSATGDVGDTDEAGDVNGDGDDGGVAAAVLQKLRAAPLRRRLLNDAGDGVDGGDPARWKDCYPGDEEGRALSVAFAVDTRYYQDLCGGSQAGVDTKLAQVLSGRQCSAVHIRMRRVHGGDVQYMLVFPLVRTKTYHSRSDAVHSVPPDVSLQTSTASSFLR
jgi:hypothetical protein